MSASISATFSPSAASAIPRFAVVVVLPTPPLPEVITITLPPVVPVPPLIVPAVSVVSSSVVSSPVVPVLSAISTPKRLSRVLSEDFFVILRANFLPL